MAKEDSIDKVQVKRVGNGWLVTKNFNSHVTMVSGETRAQGMAELEICKAVLEYLGLDVMALVGLPTKVLCPTDGIPGKLVALNYEKGQLPSEYASAASDIASLEKDFQALPSKELPLIKGPVLLNDPRLVEDSPDAFTDLCKALSQKEKDPYQDLLDSLKTDEERYLDCQKTKVLSSKLQDYVKGRLTGALKSRPAKIEPPAALTIENIPDLMAKYNPLDQERESPCEMEVQAAIELFETQICQDLWSNVKDLNLIVPKNLRGWQFDKYLDGHPTSAFFEFGWNYRRFRFQITFNWYDFTPEEALDREVEEDNAKLFRYEKDGRKWFFLRQRHEDAPFMHCVRFLEFKPSTKTHVVWMDKESADKGIPLNATSTEDTYWIDVLAKHGGKNYNFTMSDSLEITICSYLSQL